MAERREQTALDEVLTRIGQVVMLHHAGDREEARSRFLDLWTEIGEDGDPLHRCTLAHYLADTQDDPADELAWDLRALAAARELPEGGPRGVPGFFPSLHVNLAADYIKLARPEAARTHLTDARTAAQSLADDGYGKGVRAAIGRLESRLEERGPGGGGPWGPPRQRPS
ncbi:hypothetical protein [Streptomyces malaysiense]|uniref:Tetratricopeptide repeat protein n=1 Tax=Streptomyces malaysiense TaxID=1428626 RepID=A0A1J4Q7T0_9ACTN|nr:hypothetical protein [Streptomyces malaysiense]OIK28556.1 hypothetical protein VT52_005790 [Streptomyces malaysiense]